MIGTPASETFADRRGASGGPGARREANPSRRGLHPLTRLNVVCLDAPLVAVSWQWLFARSFEIAVPAGGSAALFLTAWLIYLADRLGDSLSMQRQHATSLRQRFCFKHRRAWIVALAIVGLADLFVVSLLLDSRLVVFAVPVAALAIAYLILNQRCPVLWQSVPVKEMTIGVLFAGGVIVALAPQLVSSAILPWLLFATLCSSNCIGIAVWERWLDEAQNRVSIATAFPRVGGYLPVALLLLAIGSVALASGDSRQGALSVCIATSASLLLFVHLMRHRIPADVRTALADLVLLTPAIVWLGMLLD